MAAAMKPLDGGVTAAVAMGRDSWNAAGGAGARHITAGPSGPAPAEGQVPPVLPHWADPDAPWIVIEHRADAGAQVRNDLRRNGFEVHWPREVVRIPGRDDSLRPYFPGYMFALPVSDRASWHQLKERGQFSIHVLGLRELGRPARPPAGFVAALIQRAGGDIDGVIPAKQDEIARLKSGDRVRVTAFGRDDWNGVFVAERGKRVEVLLTLFGRDAPILLEARHVRRV
jgi:transcription antitermination factor NusG